jgi:uncharacterized phage protein (TIGR01671 family)
MKRKLKFRAWDETHKIMHHNFQFIKSGDKGNDWIVFTSDKQKLTDKPHPLENPYFSQQLKIMQFTGLHDKNGKEIFEGDILNKKTTFENNMADRRFQSDTEIQVGFDDGYFLDINTRVVLFERMIIISSYPQKTWTDYEIIGNLYENYELINPK